MKWRYLVLLTFLVFAALAGCSKDGINNSTISKTFPTEEDARNNFLIKNPRSDVEYIKTTDNDELFIVRSGNNQYSTYGMDSSNEGFSVVKLTATISLHNTIAGNNEFTTPKGNDYTFLVVKEDKIAELNYNTKRKYKVLPIYSGDADLAINKGHIIDNDNSDLPESVIQSTKTISNTNVSS